MPVIRPLQNGEVTAPKLASGAAVSNIGFTPLQQGGGTSQLPNKVYIGWDGANLRAQVDGSDFAAKWPINSRNGAQAWVNFTGVGVVAIRGSYNVSSVTDNGVGDYSVNYTTAMANTNYAVTTGNLAAGSVIVGAMNGQSSLSTGSVVIGSRTAGGALIDADLISVSVLA